MFRKLYFTDDTWDNHGNTAGVYSINTDGSNLNLIYNEAGEDDFEGVEIDGKEI